MITVTIILFLLTLTKNNLAIEKIHKKDLYNTVTSDTCDEFFHGSSWPMPKSIQNRGIVKLCQVQQHKNVMGPHVFATLFSTKERIPVYTANAITLHKNSSEYPRPDTEYWNRVAYGLCHLNQLPDKPIVSDIRFLLSNHTDFKSCRNLQAVSEDYMYNDLHLDRGHLSPNSINSRDLEKQRGTFTLTNAAPQFAEFNRNSWREYECVTEHSILDLVAGETVYILTGTYGTAVDKNGNPLWLNDNQTSPEIKMPVKVPGYYWKAVCYPGSQSKYPWGYAIVQKNENLLKKADYKNYITLKEFAYKYFEDPPFGPECMNAQFGEFSKIFSDWIGFLDRHCAEETLPDQKFEL